ncbi:dioxygenase [Microbacterium rhizomatis]|uniref:Dioxygenase n=1 Tax=Microbacterium rhizomatis TaxID=1631477 RepID=A0A5J5J6R1_9MICO|nr:dioxygenase [Microbacterium rhizomatis]KAA9110548.1 dioxygenase [Microbacterium rhizomatis]
MATGARSRDNRDERERARIYQARLALHEDQIRRRYRDNVLAGIVGGVIVLAIIGAQTAYFVMGPGAPAPVPGSTPSSSVSPEPTTSTAPTSPAPTP